MRGLLLLAAAAGLPLGLVAGCAGGPPPAEWSQPASVSNVQSAQAEPQVSDEKNLSCYTEQATGSHLRAHKVCRTQAQVEADERSTQSTIESFRQGGAPRPSY